MDLCPDCGSNALDRDEVDIGVGTQTGPWRCLDCGWEEKPEPEIAEMATELDDDDWVLW